MMEVILFEDIDSLGKVGAVIKVKDGYARNYLIPKKKAYLATPNNLKRIERQKIKEQKQYEEEKKRARELSDKIGGVSCTVTVEVNDLDKMYGSVSEQDIVKALEVEGFSIDKRAIMLDKPIEELGIYEVGLKLHPEVSTNIRLWVTKK